MHRLGQSNQRILVDYFIRATFTNNNNSSAKKKTKYTDKPVHFALSEKILFVKREHWPDYAGVQIDFKLCCLSMPHSK